MYLQDTFDSQLEQTVERFNGFAESGQDDDFQRGVALADSQWTVSPLGDAANKHPSVSMHPLSSEGPYYCLIIAPSIIDTKGGPAIDPETAQVLKNDGTLIEALENLTCRRAMY